VPITTDVVNSNPAQGDVLDTALCDKICQWLCGRSVAFSGSYRFPTNTADRHDITEILLKVESYKFTIRTQSNEKRKNASHERYEKYTKRTHDTRTNYPNTQANERTIHEMNERYTNERIIGA
jgi:hypothetical protein